MLPGYFCFCYSLTKHYQGKIYCILQAHSMFTLCLELLNTVRPQRLPFRFPFFVLKNSCDIFMRLIPYSALRSPVVGHHHFQAPALAFGLTAYLWGFYVSVFVG